MWGNKVNTERITFFFSLQEEWPLPYDQDRQSTFTL